MYVCFIILILLPFCFRYALFYHKSEHKNLLELIIYSIEVLMVSEFCWNENFGSEQLLISQPMLFNSCKRVSLMTTYLLQCRKKFPVDSASKLKEHRICAILKIMIKPCSFRWLSPSLKHVNSFNPKGYLIPLSRCTSPVIYWSGTNNSVHDMLHTAWLHMSCV